MQQQSDLQVKRCSIPRLSIADRAATAAHTHEKRQFRSKPVITNIQLIRNLGQFESTGAGAKLPLNRLTLIYAENGRGKTTLAAILRSLTTQDPSPVLERRRLNSANEPHIVLTCDDSSIAVFERGVWSRTLSDIAVFDDEFVKQNICSSLGVEHEHRRNLHNLILGHRGVTLARHIEELEYRISSHDNRLRARGAAIPLKDRGALPADEYCALSYVADIDAKIETAERTLLAIETPHAIQTSELLEPISAPVLIRLESLHRLLNMEIPAIEPRSTTRVNKKFKSLGDRAEEWISEAFRRFLRNKQITHCPFCDQHLADTSLIDDYRTYFANDYPALKNHLERQSVYDFFSWNYLFENSIQTFLERCRFWARYLPLPEARIDTAALSRNRKIASSGIEAALKAKKAAPLDRVALDDNTRAAIEALDEQTRDIVAINTEIEKANAAIRRLKQDTRTSDADNARRELVHLKTIKSRHTPDIAHLCSLYVQEMNARAETVCRLEKARADLDRHTAQAFPAYEAGINEYLAKFSASFRITAISSAISDGHSTCRYSLVFNEETMFPLPTDSDGEAIGVPTFSSTLSAGDRATLALSFFLASLNADERMGEKIVVLDDPISSLDESRSLATAQQVRAISRAARQVIVLSHDKRFLCQVLAHADQASTTTLTLTRTQAGSDIAAWPVRDDLETDYDRQHGRLRAYLSGNTGNARQVAQDLRHVLEGFLRRACPEHFLPGEVLGNFRRRVQALAATTRPILPSAAATELDAILEYANRYHHETSAGWETETINDTELRSWVARTLNFLHR